MSADVPAPKDVALYSNFKFQIESHPPLYKESLDCVFEAPFERMRDKKSTHAGLRKYTPF